MKTETMVLIGLGVIGLYVFTHYEFGYDEAIGTFRIKAKNPFGPAPLPGQDYRYGPPGPWDKTNSVGERIQEIETGIKAGKSIFDDIKGMFS